ncbi:MAG: serine hydrolase domain-containing protein [Candidatus Izemoplasmatales bacterium]|jgi:CubicO group peptidase (beta-lactamase class C family)
MVDDLKVKLNDYIGELTKNTAGISAAIIQDSKTIYENYFGYIDEFKTPNSSSAMMMIGSNTKVVTAIAILQLYENGVVDIDTDITKYISELNIKSRFANKDITIRNILMHRSGLASDDLNFITSHSTCLEEIVEIANQTPLSYEPLTMYAYSNIGYGLLGVIIQRMSKVSYETYVNDHILDPIGARFEFIPNDSERIHNDENISQSFDNGLKAVKDPLNTIISAGTNTYCKLGDLISLIKVFIEPDKQKLLKKETISLMLERPYFDDMIDGEMTHGLGLVYQMYNFDNPQIGDVISHGGDTIYHHTRFAFVPKLNVGFVVMTNTENGLEVSMKIVLKMMEEYFKQKNIPIKPLSIRASKVMEIIENDIQGIYEGPTNRFVIHKEPDGLYVNIQGLELKLLLREDGFFMPVPTGVATSPQFSGMFDNLLLHIKKINGKKILFGKVYNGIVFHSAKIAYETFVEDIEKYSYIFGKYKLVDRNISDSIVINDVSILEQSGQIKLKMNSFNQKLLFNLKGLGCNALEIQGYGRFSGDTIIINKRNGEVSIKLLGFILTKI